jgi:tRNA threonylcarbamoyladenosine biosynthesis protein TsaB
MQTAETEMKILAVDTATISGSIALLEGPRVLCEWTMQSAQTHNRRLLKSIDFFLREIGWTLAQIDGFAVTIGPGSFTGLRIGLSTVKTLAWSLKKPFKGIPSLDALAAPLAFAALPVCTLLDAHKKEVFYALYESDSKGRLRRVGEAEVLAPEKILERIKTPTIFCGDGWLLYRNLLLEKLGDFAIEASAPYHIIRSSFVGELARQAFLAGDSDDPMTAVPIYVRASEAEIKFPSYSTDASWSFEKRHQD